MLCHASIEIAIRNVWPVADPSVKRAEESATQAVERAEVKMQPPVTMISAAPGMPNPDRGTGERGDREHAASNSFVPPGPTDTATAVRLWEWTLSPDRSPRVSGVTQRQPRTGAATAASNVRCNGIQGLRAKAVEQDRRYRH
jgi:hypothetical protein